MSGDGLHEELLLELACPAFSRAMISAPRYFASIETEAGVPQYGKLFEQQVRPGPGQIGGVNRRAEPPSMYS